ncbi:MAG: type II secretion system protein GspL [Gammaproteobacteria bacterium]|nr:type II secretion system protein GspL [Gammaproteobacteria bacterium]
MRVKLFIRFNPSSPDEVDWLRMDEPARHDLTVHHAPLPEVAAAAAGCRVILLVPGAEVLLTTATVPGGSRQKIASAVPYALEEQLASDVDNLHFALGERHDDGRTSTAVMVKTQLGAWLECLRQAGIEPDAIAPDILALPWVNGTWTVLMDGDRALVRTAHQTGFVADGDNLDTLLRLALNEAGDARPERIRIIHQSDNAPPELSYDLDTTIDTETVDEPVLAILSRGYDEPGAINLLQGAYSRHEQLGRLWRPWRPVAALAAVLLLIQGGMTVADYMRLNSERQTLAKQIEQVYLQTFPDARKVVNARVQMEERLKELRGGGADEAGFMGLLADIGPGLKETPSVEVQRISYNEGKIDLALLIADLQSLDKLKQRLTTQRGLSVDIQSAANRDGRVEALLQIKGKTS